MEGRTDGRTEGRKAENYVPPLFFKKAGDKKLWPICQLDQSGNIPLTNENQRTNGPVNAHLISWPSKAQNKQNLENIW